jgi:hypothetical protein
MNRKTIAYWTVTGLFSFAMLGGGVADLLGTEEMLQGFAHLGYPAYLLTLLGLWKIAGVAAITAPGLGRLKEWAYAGFAFNLTGAAVSHLAVGDGAGQLVAPLALLALGTASWWLRPASRQLGAAEAAPAVGSTASAVVPVRAAA